MTHKGKPFRISIIKTCIWGVFLSTNIRNMLQIQSYHQYQQNSDLIPTFCFKITYKESFKFPRLLCLIFMFSQHFWMISSAMKIHSWEVSFKPLEPTNFPRCRRDSRESVQSEVGRGIFTPPNVWIPGALGLLYFVNFGFGGIYVNQL